MVHLRPFLVGTPGSGANQGFGTEVEHNDWLWLVAVIVLFPTFPFYQPLCTTISELQPTEIVRGHGICLSVLGLGVRAENHQRLWVCLGRVRVLSDGWVGGLV